MRQIKIWTQNEFRSGVTPIPGMIFVADDGNYYRLTRRHPDLKSGESGIQFTKQGVEKGDEINHPECFWAVVQLIDKEIAAIVKGERS